MSPQAQEQSNKELTKRSKELVFRTIHILKHSPITLPPYTPR